MKKKSLIFYCITLMLICQGVPVSAISDEQKVSIIEKCSIVRDNLKNIQRIDARARTFLGPHFETVLTKFVMPLNVRLVENNLSDLSLIENQNELATAKTAFGADFISYQQELENLILIDCKTEPERFYNKLEVVREKRKAVLVDVTNMKTLMLKNLKLVRVLREGMK